MTNENRHPEKGVSCAVIQDLMPQVIDGIASEESKKLVEDHIAACKDCKEVYEAMKAPEPDIPSTDSSMKSALKKTGQTLQRHRWLLAVCIAGLLVLMGICAALIVQAGKIDAASLDVQVHQDPEGLWVEIEPDQSGIGLLSGSVHEEEDGRVNIEVLGGSGLYDQHPSLAYTLSDKGQIRSIFCNDTLIWQDGMSIDETVRKLFAFHDGYAGDAPRISKLADLLKLQVNQTGFSMKLDTDDPESCGWTFFVPDGTETDLKLVKGAQSVLKKKSFILFALTPNLQTVGFGIDPEKPVIKVDRKEYREWLGEENGNLQENPQTPAQMQLIWNLLML